MFYNYLGVLIVLEKKKQNEYISLAKVENALENSLTLFKNN